MTLELDGPGAPKPDALPKWNLKQICADSGECISMLEAAIKEAKTFENTYRGRVATLSAAELAEALDWQARIENRAYRPMWYAGLGRSLNERSAEALNLTNKVRSLSVEFSEASMFFDLEWQAIDAATAGATAQQPELAAYRHYLDGMTKTASHSLPEAQERLLTALSSNVLSRTGDLHGGAFADFTVTVETSDGPQLKTLEEALAMLYSDSSREREVGFDSVTQELQQKNLRRIASWVYGTKIAERLNSDRERGFSHPMEPANISNDLGDQCVDDLMTAVRARYGVSQQWWDLKATLLGKRVLTLYDRYAPIGGDGAMSFGEATKTVLAAAREFSPRIAQIMADAYLDGRVDAAPAVGKSGGAFCSYGPSDMLPFILLNFTGTRGDALTMAHEGGHGVHCTLANEAQNSFNRDTGMAMAEIASTFMEMVTFDHLMKQTTNPDEQLGMLAKRIEGNIATVDRQVMMAWFERDCYEWVAAGNELTADKCDEFWMNRNVEQHGESMVLPPGYRHWWEYVSHYINSRFYTYSYSFAHLVSLTLYGKYRECTTAAEREEFVTNYTELLSAGGSESPAVLLARMGIDISDPSWVDAGYREIQRMIDQARAIVLAKQKPAQQAA